MNERREDAKSSDPQNRISMRISQKRGAGLSKSRDTRRSRLIGSHQKFVFSRFFQKEHGMENCEHRQNEIKI